MSPGFKAQIEKIIGYKIRDNSISISWTVGGRTGGNCWGGEANESVTAESEPEFESLDLILTEICPHISFLQYKKLTREMVKAEGKAESEYYGNYYDKAIKSVDLTELEKYLKTIK